MTARLKNGPIVRESDRSRPRELTRVLLTCVIFSIPVFFYVWQQVSLYQIGQEIQRMERRKAELIEESRKLDLKRAQLTALGRVEDIARSALGFVDGTPIEVMALDRSQQTPSSPNLVAEARNVGAPTVPARE